MGNSTNINWYPGHMAKTKREIAEDMKIIDVVIEILDARIPMSSQNPDIQGIIKNKKKIILLNKCDLADEKETKKWQSYFKSKGIETVLINANDGQGMKQVTSKIEEVMKEEIEREAKKGRTGKTIRALVLRNSKCT
ncbi:MAG: ribosome biogenesis GTPase YlqF, partial [Clostridia bacterium]|nr:ribosome biogenesis GTPase YlqF [Clostridia bacterium]